jgi:hypothetical protein
MTHDKYREMLIDDVVPAIMEKWPIGEWSNPAYKIKIQQDGAGAHCSAEDNTLMAAIHELEENGIMAPGKISFFTQPAQSPDLNILDLGLFNALQQAYYGSSPTNSLEIIECVQEAYKQYPANKINRLFVTQQSVFNCILEHHGDNTFKIPHMNKEFMEREGTLPRCMKVSDEAYEVVFMDSEDESDDDGEDRESLYED